MRAAYVPRAGPGVWHWRSLHHERTVAGEFQFTGAEQGPARCQEEPKGKVTEVAVQESGRKPSGVFLQKAKIICPIASPHLHTRFPRGVTSPQTTCREEEQLPPSRSVAPEGDSRKGQWTFPSVSQEVFVFFYSLPVGSQVTKPWEHSAYVMLTSQSGCDLYFKT